MTTQENTWPKDPVKISHAWGKWEEAGTEAGTKELLKKLEKKGKRRLIKSSPFHSCIKVERQAGE